MVINGVSAGLLLLAAALSDLVGTNRVIAGTGILLACAAAATISPARRVFARG